MKADLAAGAALTALGLLMTISSGDLPGALLVPLATLPVIWRQKSPEACAVILSAGIVLTFGQPRCGAVVPAALLVLYALGTCSPSLGAPALVLAALVFLSFTDPIIGPGALEVFLPLAAGAWGAGRLVRSRNRVAAELAARSQELERQRERTAELAVAVERTRLARKLDLTARDRTREMVALAAAGAREGDRAAFGRIEALGRESLNEMRELLGVLRSDVPADRAPQPTLAQLDALLGEGLEIEGERRALPSGVELTAYRIVELALAGKHPERVRVQLRYRPDALELEVNGAAAAAVEAARERVSAHGGTFVVDAGRAVLRARLPAHA